MTVISGWKEEKTGSTQIPSCSFQSVNQPRVNKSSIIRARIIQLVERQAEKSGAILTLRVGVHGVASDFFLAESTSSANSKHWFTTSFLGCRKAVLGACLQCRLSYGVLTTPVSRAIACINVCTPVKNPPNPSLKHTLFGHTKLLHTLTGTGIALLLRLLCLTQVRPPEFPARDNEVVNMYM